jgi:hypothetical protein
MEEALQALFAALFLSLGTIKVMQARLLTESSALLVCVTAQQLVFASAAYYIRRGVLTDELRITAIKGLMAICVLAGLFAVMMPPLFKELATSGVVPIDPSDLVFAIPVILVTLVGVIHMFRGYKN